MTVKTSISLTDQQIAYARGLVERGEYSSVSAVLQRSLEMLRHENEAREAEMALMRKLIAQRRRGQFITLEEAERRTLAMLDSKRTALGKI